MTSLPLPVLRTVAVAIALVGIVGMIAGSAADNNNGVVVTFGSISAIAAIVLLAVSAATVPRRGADPADELAAALEDRIRELADAGADERALRQLVRDAVRLGREHSGPRA